MYFFSILCPTRAWFLIVLLTLSSFCRGLDRKSDQDPPNIIFILADDFGFIDVGYHGSDIKTPWLDKLAAEGVKLENYYVQPICTPTRSQLMSGRYQIHTGLEHKIIHSPQPSCLPLEDPTLAQKLKELGYSTHAVGKWHLGFYKKDCWPTRRGFDTFFGFLGGSEDYYTHIYKCFMPGYNCSQFAPGYDFRDQEEPAPEYAGLYSTQLFAERAEQILENSRPNKPFFLYLPFQAPHVPLEVPDQYVKPYQDVKDHNRRIHSAMVACMDEAIGNITQKMTELGLWENTVLIFSTDNGGEPTQGGGYNWPLRGVKGTLWEGGIHGVGFVYSPLIPDAMRGTSNRQLIHVSDWFPTLVAGLAGGSLEGLKLDGFNVWNTISQGSPSPRTEILHNIDPCFKTQMSPFINCSLAGNKLFTPSRAFNTTTRAAIRVGDWKLLTGKPGPSKWVPLPDSGIVPIYPIEQEGKHVWLFNIQADPNEYHDLSEARPDKVKEMIGRLQYYYSGIMPPFYPPVDRRANPALHDGFWTNWE